jgi:hypothetical protein
MHRFLPLRLPGVSLATAAPAPRNAHADDACQAS